MVNTLIFMVLWKSSTKIPFYISLLLFIGSFIGCIVIWSKWKLMKDPNIDQPADEDEINEKSGYLNLKLLSMKYIHPV